MPKQNQSNKKRKVGRNQAKCQAYRNHFQRDRNKERKAKKRQRGFRDVIE